MRGGWGLDALGKFFRCRRRRRRRPLGFRKGAVIGFITTSALDARIDPSRLLSTDGPNCMEGCRRKKSNIKKTV